MISFIDHIAIAVKDYEAAYRFFTGIFGAIPGTCATDPGMGYLWQNLSLGNLSRLELLTPRGDESFLDNFLSEKQGGVHHITMHTPDIEKARERLDEMGVPYFGYARLGPIWKELFIHPRDAFGVLIQIAEFNPDDWISPHSKMPEGKKFLLEKNNNGVVLKVAHPGGGRVEIPLKKDDIKALLDELGEFG